MLAAIQIFNLQTMRLPLPQFVTDNRQPDKIAEVIETSTTQFMAESLEPEDLSFPLMPPFGSWVKSFDEESGNKILGVVCHVTTTPTDSLHRVRALGLSLAEIRNEQPQILGMLTTKFQALIVGFETTPSSPNGHTPSFGKVYQYLPPRPPQIHQAVYRCHPSEIINFSENLNFLRILLQISTVPKEALIAATIREIYQLRDLNRSWLVKAGRTLTVLLREDYDTLQYILSQIHI